MRTLGVVLFAATLAAQTVDRTKPPETPPLAAYKLPPTFESTLANGLRIVIVRDQRLPIVTARLGFQAGAKFDPKEMSGLSEMTAGLLKEGTKTRNSRQIAEEMADIGGSIDAVSGPDNLVIGANALAEHTVRLLDALSDIARNAEFPESELKLRRQNREQELLAQRADSSTVADEKLLQVLFGSHPYSRLLPTAESIAKISRDALLGFRRQFLAPNNGVLLLIGALPPQAELMKMIAARFASWPRAQVPPAPSTPFPGAARSIVLVDRPGSVQADLRVGKLGTDRTSPDYFPLAVANQILGGGANSRLFLNIREEKGYAYDAHSEQRPRRVGGYFTAVTQVRNDVVEPALRDVLAELKRISSEPVQKDELTDVKNYIAGTFVLRLETQRGLADQLAMVSLDGLPKDYLSTYITRVRSVEPDQILNAARKYIAPENAAIVVVGDAKQIGKPLEKFGKTTIEQAK